MKGHTAQGQWEAYHQAVPGELMTLYSCALFRNHRLWKVLELRWENCTVCLNLCFPSELLELFLLLLITVGLLATICKWGDEWGNGVLG